MKQRRINVRGIVYREGEILVVNQKDSDGNPSDYWCLPGGGVDDYEPLDDAMKREFVEEMGITPKLSRIILGQQFKSNRSQYNEELEFFYLVEDSAEYDNIDLTKTSHGVEEISEIKFADPTKLDNLYPAFLRTINLKEYAENTLPINIMDNLNEKTV